MKKILFSVFLFAALQSGAQESALMSRDFWQDKPNLEAVKAELAKGFDFKDVHGAADPIFLSITTDAPVAVTKYLIDQPGVDFKHTTVEGRIYLHIAANKSNAEVTDYLITKGSDMEMLDANGHTALTFAAYQGSLTAPLVEAFAKHGIDIKKKFANKEGANLILLEVPFDKDLSLTDYLISKGVSINATDNNGNTAFDHAAKIGNVEIMKALLKRGIKSNGNALIIASQGTYRSANKIEVYQYLVDELKMNPLVTNKNGQNVLHSITRKQNQAEIIKYFFAKGVDINKVDKDGNTPFIGAAGGKSLEVVEMMLPKVKNINAVNAKGESALFNAVKGSTAEVVALLLKNGANANVINKEGQNLPFILVDAYRPQGGGRGGRGPAQAPAGGVAAAPKPAAKDDFADKLAVLKEKGVNFTALQKDGSTLYHIAIAKNDIALLKNLSSLNIDVNAKNKEGLTPLHKAAMVAKDDKVLKYLISIGAKKEIKTDLGETAYALTQENDLLTKNNVAVDFLK